MLLQALLKLIENEGQKLGLGSALHTESPSRKSKRRTTVEKAQQELLLDADKLVAMIQAPAGGSTKPVNSSQDGTPPGQPFEEAVQMSEHQEAGLSQQPLQEIIQTAEQADVIPGSPSLLRSTETAHNCELPASKLYTQTSSRGTGEPLDSSDAGDTNVGEKILEARGQSSPDPALSQREVSEGRIVTAELASFRHSQEGLDEIEVSDLSQGESQTPQESLQQQADGKQQPDSQL